MGKYDRFLVGLSSAPASPPAKAKAPSASGKYDKFLSGLSRGALGVARTIPEIDALSTIAELKGPADAIHAQFPEQAGNLAEYLGSKGFDPKVSAALTTPIALAPEIASSAMGIGQVVAGQGPLAKAIRNTPRMLSPRYDALNEAAGISKDLPVQGGRIPKFPNLAGLPSNAPPPQAPMVAPKMYPKDTNSFLNFARGRVESLGKKLSSQELHDYHTIINTAMRDGDIVPGTNQHAIASKLGKQVASLLGKAVPGREELDEIYALSKKLRVVPEVAKTIWKFLGPKLRYGVIGVP